jgi:hypothetical protein
MAGLGFRELARECTQPAAPTLTPAPRVALLLGCDSVTENSVAAASEEALAGAGRGVRWPISPEETRAQAGGQPYPVSTFAFSPFLFFIIQNSLYVQTVAYSHIIINIVDRR